jgi:hypothetical protein
MVELGEDFQGEWGYRLGASYLHHLVDVLWGNEEEDVPQGGNNDLLFRDVVSLALECKLREMVDLGEKI